jgi:hypothetical protein
MEDGLPEGKPVIDLVAGGRFELATFTSGGGFSLHKCIITQ